MSELLAGIEAKANALASLDPGTVLRATLVYVVAWSVVASVIAFIWSEDDSESFRGRFFKVIVYGHGGVVVVVAFILASLMLGAATLRRRTS